MPPKKKVLAVVKIQLPAGTATPAPPVGTALGPHGVQTMEFCKQYNAATESQRGTVVPVEITIYEDRSFTFVLKTPPTPVLLRQAAGLEKGAATTGREQVGHGHRRPAGRDRHRSSCRTSTPTTSRRPSGRWPARPGRWASRSPARPATGEERRDDPARQEVQGEPGQGRPGAALRRRRGGRPGQGAGQRQVRRDGRAGRPPRRRPPQGRPDRPRHALAARRAPGAPPGWRSSPPARRRPRPGRPGPTWSAPTTWWPGSTAASSTSTWPSPPRT